MNTAELLANLSQAVDPEQKAALIAEFALLNLPPRIARVARGCVSFHWFTEQVIEALSEHDVAESVRAAATIVTLPFVEKLPWGYAYHQLTRRGLLAQIGKTDQASLIVDSCRVALHVYLQDWQSDQAALEAFYCLVVAGEQEEAVRRLQGFLTRCIELHDWEHSQTILELWEEAQAFAFVKPLPLSIADYWLGLGNLREAYDDPGFALEAYNRAILLDSSLVDAYYGRARIYDRLDEVDRAVWDYSKVVELDPAHAAAYNDRGVIRSKMGDPDAALADYARSIALDTDDVIAYQNQCLLLIHMGELDEAEADYRAADRLAPDDRINSACRTQLDARKHGASDVRA